MPGGRPSLYRAILGALVWVSASGAQAPPPRLAKPVYLIAFQREGQTGGLGDLAGFATTTMRLRLSGVKSLKYLDGQTEAPCRQPRAEGAGSSTQGAGVSAVVPTHYVVSGSVEVRYQDGKASEINLAYSLDKVERCQVKNLLQSRVPMAPGEALSRFRSMGEVIALRLDEELSDRAAVIIEPVATSSADEQTKSWARLLERLLGSRLADSDDFRPASGAARESAHYRLLPSLETAARRSRRIDSLKLRIEAGGKVYDLPAAKTPADQTEGAMLALFGDAADSALQALAEIRYRAESGLPDDPEQVQTSLVVSKADSYLRQGQPRAALALFSGLPPNRPLTLEALVLKARALFDTADFLASAKAADAAAEAARKTAPVVQARVLQLAGAAWYRARDYASAAERYRILLTLAHSDTEPAAEVKALIRDSARWRVACLGLAGKPDQALEEYPSLRKLADDPSEIDSEARRLLNGIASIQQLRRATELLVPRLGSDSPVLSRSWQRIGDDVYATRDFEKARGYYKSALAGAEKQAPPDQHQIAFLLNLMGNTYMETSRSQESIPYYEKAIEKAHVAGPSEDRQLIAYLTNLAAALQVSGAFDQTEPKLKEAKTLTEENYGASSPQAAEVDAQLGSLYTDWGKHAEADPLLSSAVGILEKQTPRNDTFLVWAYARLGWLRCEMDNPHDAELLFRKAQSILESRGETATVAYSELLDNLSTTHTLKGEYTQAVSLQRRALELSAKLDNPRAAVDATFNLCVSLFDLQNYREASSECQKAQASYLSIYGAGHWMNAYTMLELADIRSAQAVFSAADKLYREGLDLYGANPAKSRWRMLVGQATLGRLRYREGRYSEAEEMLKDIREALIKDRGGRDTRVADVDDLLGWTLWRLGRPQAEASFQAAIKSYEARGLPDHPTAASSREGLARLALASGDLNKAEVLCERALAARLKAFGYDSEAVADSIDCLGLVAAARGAYPAAAAHFERALAAYGNAFGPQHPKIAETLEHYAALRKATGETAESTKLANRANAIRSAFQMP
jgi:hypothetical protein